MASAAVTLVTIGAPAALLAACGDTTWHSGTASTVLAPNATVVRVVDGDTIVVDLGGQTERVRLIGVNTPETVDPRVPVQCFGREASDHLHEMLPEGSGVRLERDVEERDRYGRLLAYVWRAGDGAFVNLELLDDGYGQVLSIPPNIAYVDRFRAAQQTARDAERGLWSSCPNRLSDA